MSEQTKYLYFSMEAAMANGCAIYTLPDGRSHYVTHVAFGKNQSPCMFGDVKLVGIGGKYKCQYASGKWIAPIRRNELTIINPSPQKLEDKFLFNYR